MAAAFCGVKKQGDSIYFSDMRRKTKKRGKFKIKDEPYTGVA